MFLDVKEKPWNNALKYQFIIDYYLWVLNLGTLDRGVNLYNETLLLLSVCDNELLYSEYLEN